MSEPIYLSGADAAAPKDEALRLERRDSGGEGADGGVV
jgi:hypothetical protein